MKLSSVRLVSHDVPALSEFYAQLTGVGGVGDADYTEFATSGGTVALCSLQAFQSASPGVSAEPLANSSVLLEFEVEDVDAFRARLVATGTQWVQEPTDQPWGNRSALVRDPDGNLVNLFTPIPDAVREWPSQMQG